MNHNIIFKAIVGSQAYSTTTANSDIDLKGVYIQSPDDILSFNYEPQINVTKDETYYEVRRFLELLQAANSTMLELLYMPSNCILIKKPEFDLILNHRDKFLTKRCLESFGGYATAQIKKASGLDKKMNWEQKDIKRKTILDFCYVLYNEGSMPFKKWLELVNKTREYAKLKAVTQEDFGLANIDHGRDMYALYCLINYNINDKKGIVSDELKSNDVRLTSIPKEANDIHYMYFNKNGFSIHCKKYREYEEWLSKRNVNRYVDNINHGQKVDGKNLNHCRRLLDMAIEIAKEGTINVKRPNAEYLLKIKRGEVPLLEIIDKANEDILILNDLYKNCSLPDDVDKQFVNELLLEIRHFK